MLNRLNFVDIAIPDAIKIGRATTPCIGCVSRSTCLHSSLDTQKLERLTGQYTQKLKIKSGDPIIHNGNSIHSLYTIRAGFIKLEYILPNGQHQVSRFATQGDLIGADGIADGKHHLDAIALTDGEICAINYTQLRILMNKEPILQKSLECAMSKELNDMQEHIFSLGSHTVEQKIAFFLIELQNKLGRINSQFNSIRLPMNRDDLKSYLGVTSESLSRALTSLETKKYFRVRNREISEINYKKLIELIGSIEDN